MESYLNKGHARRVPDDELNTEERPHPNPSSSNLQGNSVNVELQAASGGVPVPSLSLSQQTPTFLASGSALPEQQVISSPSATQGRPKFTVSFFVGTFATLCSPILSTSIMAGASVPVPLSNSTLAANLPSGPLLQQPFSSQNG